MTARPNLVAVLRGTTAEGEPSEIALRILVETITRTIGLYGDPVEVECPHDEWPEEWDLGGRFTIEIGQTGDPDPEVITLGGYRLIRRTPVGFGAVRGSDPEEITPARYLVRLDTLWGFWRDARGGIIRQQTFNALGPDGLVDTGSAQYRTVQQLVDYALNAMTGAEFPNDPAPSALNLAIDGVTTVVAPGPLDWGNARAMPELEALLAQVGWSAVFANDGQTLALVRLARAGATFELPSWMAEFAEPYELTPVAGVRSSRIVITSGRTRTTMLSDRSLDGTAAPALVWCMQDEETGEWIDQTEAAQLAAFNAGPRGADGTTREFAKAFTAVRIAASEREALSAFVAIPQAPASGSWAAFTRSAVLVTMRGVAVEPGGELANVPASGDPIIVAGAAAIPGEGVIILPTSLRAARISGADRGAYAQAVALDGDDLTVVIAHESRSGEHLIDYYVSAWEISEDGGVLSVERLEDEAQAEAIFSPEVPKIEAPFLRRVMVWPAGDEDPTPVNDDDLHEAARQIALARGAADRAVVGTITLRGLHDVEPGGAGGAITAVTWDLVGQRTILSINQHEAPHSFWDMLEARAGRSIGGGLSRRTMPGSAVASTDSRDGSAPSDLAAIGGPEAAPAARGRERASVESRRGVVAPQPESSLPSVAEACRMDAVITGSSSIGDNRWSYSWSQVVCTGSAWEVVSGGPSSASEGVALNTVEAANDGEGVEGPGYNVDPPVDPAQPAITLNPISSGTVVSMVRRGSVWQFTVSNGVDLGPAAMVQRIRVLLTGHEPLPDRDFGWLYDWEEVEHTGAGWNVVLDGRTSATLGKARNHNEHSYGPSVPTYFAPGYETAKIPPGFAPRPIRGAPVVEIEGPYLEEEDETFVQRWYFRAENAIDGECVVEPPEDPE